MEKAEEYKAKGNSYFKEKNFEKSIKYYTKAINKNPNNSIYYSNRALVYNITKEYEKAIEDGKKANDLDEKNIKAYLTTAKSLFSLNKLKESYETIQKGLKNDPKNELLLEFLNTNLKNFSLEKEKEIISSDSDSDSNVEEKVMDEKDNTSLKTYFDIMVSSEEITKIKKKMTKKYELTESKDEEIEEKKLKIKPFHTEEQYEKDEKIYSPFKIIINPSDTVIEVLLRIQEKTNFSLDKFFLVKDGYIMEKDVKIKTYNIFKNKKFAVEYIDLVMNDSFYTREYEKKYFLPENSEEEKKRKEEEEEIILLDEKVSNEPDIIKKINLKCKISLKNRELYHKR
jgi:hypothetical protein